MPQFEVTMTRTIVQHLTLTHDGPDAADAVAWAQEMLALYDDNPEVFAPEVAPGGWTIEAHEI